MAKKLIWIDLIGLTKAHADNTIKNEALYDMFTVTTFNIALNLSPTVRLFQRINLIFFLVCFQAVADKLSRETLSYISFVLQKIQHIADAYKIADCTVKTIKQEYS